MLINTNSLEKKVIKYRRDLHQIPELSFDLPETNAYVRDVLCGFSCSIHEIAVSGIVAFFDFGKEESVCFRGDMDGLPIQEVSNAAYKSKHDGKMHACGHDAHTAGLLGFAEVLDNLKSENFSAGYNAVLLFQPAEETIDGALKVCNEGFFEKYNIRYIFGVHNWPTLPKGQISSIPGPMMAISASIDVDFDGVSAHCGEPEKGCDALLAAARFINEIYDYNENCIDEKSIIRFGKLTSGNVRNAISSKSTLLGTIRAFQQETWHKLVEEMNRIAERIQSDLGVKVKVDVIRYHPAVINNPALYEHIIPYIEELGYKELEKPVMIAEDFSFFQEQVPGIFFFLGTGSGIPLHSNNYDMDDTIIMQAVKLFERIFISI